MIQNSCGVWEMISKPAKKAALKVVVATWLTPPPTASSSSPALICGAGTKPRARVRSPSTSLSEKVPPAGISVRSRIRAARRMLVTRG